MAQHLRAWIAYGGGGHDLRYWRTKSGSEVDFVVYGEDEFLALVVKASKTVSPRDTRGLRAFLEDYPDARACLLYGGRERISIAGMPCLPSVDFLRAMAPGVPLGSLLPEPRVPGI